MPVSQEQNESSHVICLDGSVNIAHAAELKTLLIDLLADREPLTIRLAGATDLDVCIVQLLVAAAREWKQLGVSCTLTGPMKEELSVAIMASGFEALPVTHPVNMDAGVLSEV